MNEQQKQAIAEKVKYLLQTKKIDPSAPIQIPITLRHACRIVSRKLSESGQTFTVKQIAGIYNEVKSSNGNLNHGGTIEKTKSLMKQEKSLMKSDKSLQNLNNQVPVNAAITPPRNNGVDVDTLVSMLHDVLGPEYTKEQAEELLK